MEINGAFDLLQDLIPIEQLADSTENLSELTDSDFQQLFMQETIKEAEFFAEFDKALPVAGKELPLDVEPSLQLQSSELPVISIEVQQEPEKQLEAEVPETEDPVFIMTNLLMQLPSMSTKIDFQSYSTEPLAGSHLLVEQDVMQYQPLPKLADNIQGVTFMAENDQPEITSPVQQAFALLEPSIDASVIVGNHVQSDFYKQNTLSLADNLLNDEESQRMFFESSEHATQLRDDSMVIEPSEKHSLLLKPYESEVNEQNLQEQEMQNMQHSGTKEVVKETLVIPHENPQTEAFANIFEEKLTDKITLLVNRNENVAQIQITPPELGQIDITIEQSDDKTHIKFVTHVEQTKQLIENTVDKLKMYLAQNGIELGQVDVSAGNQNQRQYAQTLPNASNGYHDASQKEVDINTSRVVASHNSQLLDLYI